MSFRDEAKTRFNDGDGGVAEGDRGASFVEYALLIALIVMVCFAAMTTLGKDTSAFYEDTAAKVAATNPN